GCKFKHHLSRGSNKLSGAFEKDCTSVERISLCCIAYWRHRRDSGTFKRTSRIYNEPPEIYPDTDCSWIRRFAAGTCKGRLAGGRCRCRGQRAGTGNRKEYRARRHCRTHSPIYKMVERRSGMSIEDWRTQIDDIDRRLVKLMNDRTTCVIEIARIKKQEKLKVVDLDRERNVYQNVEKENLGPLDAGSLTRIFGRIIEECRRIEKQVTGEK